MNEPTTPTVLFVCVSNTGKSVMAQHLMRQTAGEAIKAISAGTHAKSGEQANPVSAQALAELGIDISAHQPTPLDETLIATADLIVILGAQAHIDPPADGTPVHTWDTNEPSRRGIDGIDRMRLIRDDIATRVTALAQQMQPDPLVPPPPSDHAYDDVSGPFYDAAGLARWLGISHQALHVKVTEHALLACPIADGDTVYPAWQFLPNGATIPFLTEVLSALTQGTDDAWMVALWMQARSDRLDGHSVSDWLRSGGDPQRALAMARDIATRWKS